MVYRCSKLEIVPERNGRMLHDAALPPKMFREAAHPLMCWPGATKKQKKRSKDNPFALLQETGIAGRHCGSGVLLEHAY